MKIMRSIEHLIGRCCYIWVLDLENRGIEFIISRKGSEKYLTYGNKTTDIEAAGKNTSEYENIFLLPKKKF